MTLTHPPEPQTGVRVDVDRAGSVFRAFAIEGFQEWSSWRRLQSVLSTNGGSYGLVGPRGAGKTWLMLRAVDEARANGGVGLWFPSPSEYDPQAFLSSLSDNFAAEVERQYRSRGPLSVLYRALTPLWVIVLAGALFPIWLGLADSIPGTSLAPDSVLRPLIAAPLALASALALGGLLAGLTRVFPRGRLVAEARTLQERIRYSATLSEGNQAGAGGGQLLSITSSHQRELIERPTTISSLVHDFRRLGRHTAEVVQPARVVIAIDELDKMSDPDKVRALLRDIKGIFEIEGVHFLVSVSHEAARALRLSGIAERNEFNSSFYTAVELPALKPVDCAVLLAKREKLGMRDRLNWLRAERDKLAPNRRFTVDGEIRWLRDELARAEPRDAWPRRWAAIGVLAAGNPRETVRLADLADGNGDSVIADPACAAIATVLSSELREFRREALIASEQRLTDDEQAGLYDAVRDLVRSDEVLLAGAKAAVVDLWTPRWAQSVWRTLFAEEWRRLLIRLYVGGWIAEDERPPDDPRLAELSSVVAEASLSAMAARLSLSEPPYFVRLPSG